MDLAPKKLKFEKINVLGVKIASIPISEIVPAINSQVESAIPKQEKKLFFYVNAHCLVLVSRDALYKKILSNASLVYSGGIGPVLASRVLGRSLPGRTPTPDFIDQVFEYAQHKKWSFYFLGSDVRSNKKAVERIKKKFPGLVVAGYHHGYFDEIEEKKIIGDINRKRPSLLIVGMGSPKQEEWIWQNKDKIDARVFWSVGNLFDVISGKMSRGPVFLQRAGFEWLYRLYQEPIRLWRRYTLGNIYFLYLIIKSKLTAL